ncbi:glycerate kinase [Olsenella sp. oral taxon 809]|uniref:glycerate kinase n=1 Tax=Olsenella sp. oral taxon 809 TaxID=661086 RepID=UPI000231F0B7|nr:glycerate kinase [Olsenella sp. oral taxon 809]EHF02502.1 hypothetical protein HMPREF1008_00147 [Olsenella sp. oral taxon 809 str. F0356]
MSLSVLVASDSFKGSASSRTIAELVERGVRRVDPDARVFCLPIADGGEGTIDALLAARSGRLRHLEVRGPLGVPVDARYALLDDGCAVLEAAEAIGIGLSDRSPASALAASSFGLGQLLLDALDQDARRVLVGLGGSATSDGGAGFAKALGARLLDRYGMPVEEGLAGLVRVESLDVSGLDPRLGEVDMELLLDVTNPLVGSAGAVRVFGPQKGLDPRELDRYDGWMSGWGELLHRVCGRDVAAVEGAGAAGGLGACLMALADARPGRGIELVLDAVGIDQALAGVDLVITGEGRMDAQSACGKAPVGVARRAKAQGKPVVAVVGSCSDELEAAYAQGVDLVVPCVHEPCSLEDCMRGVERSVPFAAESAVRAFLLGRSAV